MCSDLFCAFQPKRLMVPSLPLWLKVPAMPKLFVRLAAWFLSKLESSRFSIKPRPKVGVGMRKMTLFVATACAKGGCATEQEPASERPVIVKRSSTPPLGALVLTLPFELKKKGKRASRVGPLAVMKLGMVLLGAVPSATNWNWGFAVGPDPPGAG